MRPLVLAALLGFAPATAAQLPQSTNYLVESYEMLGGFAGATSPGHWGYGALSDGSGAIASPSLLATVGFLGIHVPDPGTTPVIFGMSPPFGTKGGGTSAVVNGVNLDALGLGSTVTIGGAPAVGAAVLSNHYVSFTTPPGAAGPADVVVTNSFGSDTATGGYLYTPALVTPPMIALGGPFPHRNYGPVGAYFELWFSSVPASIPLPPFGTLAIDPGLSFKLLGGIYPAPDGIHTFEFLVPENPTLHGKTLHYQSFALLSIAPLDIAFTNGSVTTVL